MTSSSAFITSKQMQAGGKKKKNSQKIGYRFRGNGCDGSGNPRLKWHGRARLPASPSGSGNTSCSRLHQYISSGALSSNGEISRMGRNNRIFIPLIHIQFFSPSPFASLSPRRMHMSSGCMSHSNELFCRTPSPLSLALAPSPHVKYTCWVFAPLASF